jgi:D-psicose/D-tagatose/L-ribulose 3-epimerase
MRLRTGINLLLYTQQVSSEHFPLMERLRRMGYVGVELPLSEGNAEHYRSLRRELDHQGLACTAALVEDPTASAISLDPAARQAALDRLRWGIEMSATLGANVLNGEFHTPHSPARAPTTDDRKRAGDVYRQAAEFAETAELCLAIECLNRFESSFLNTIADTRTLVKQVDHQNFRMMYDTFHAHIEEKAPGRAIREAADSIIHVHISENDRGTPGSGQVRWEETFQALKAIGYDGWLVIEAFNRSVPDLATAMRLWRDPCADVEELCVRGLRFMNEQWAATTE